MTSNLGGIAVFYILAAITIAGAVWVAFARNIMHSGFALFATFFGVAGLYAFLSADLMAVIQLMVYAGGILVLILFAVMLTARMGAPETSNPSLPALPGLLAGVICAALSIFVAVKVFGPGRAAEAESMTATVGHALLTTYVLPFEAISMLLLAALLGAVTLARSRGREEDGKDDE